MHCDSLKDRVPSISYTIYLIFTLQWRHNGRGSVSNHQPHHCLLNRWFRRRSKKTSKLCVTGLCARNSPGTGEFPAHMASNAENVSIWWRHHEMIPLNRRMTGCCLNEDHRLIMCCITIFMARCVYLPLVIVARGRILMPTSHHYQTGALCVGAHTWKRNNQELDSPLKIKTPVATQANSPRNLFRKKFVHSMLFYMIMLMKLVDHHLATSHCLNQRKPNLMARRYVIGLNMLKMFVLGNLVILYDDNHHHHHQQQQQQQRYL